MDVTITFCVHCFFHWFGGFFASGTIAVPVGIVLSGLCPVTRVGTGLKPPYVVRH